MAVNAQSQYMRAPFTLALDANGEIIVGETAGLGGACPSNLTCGGVVAVDPTTGKETLISSNTIPINADSQFLHYPQGLTIGPNGDIYVADALAFGTGGGIVEVDPATGKQTELSSNELPVNASSQYFTGIGGMVFVSGSASEGQSLSTSDGTWNPAATSVAYAWQRSGDCGATWSGITGATGASYLAGNADVAPLLRVLVTATNANGQGTAASAPVDPVASQPVSSPPPSSPGTPAGSPPGNPVASPSGHPIPTAAPVCAPAPSVPGKPAVGRPLTASPGRWSPEATTYTYQWQLSRNGGTTWVSIARATARRFTPRATDLGTRLRVVVTAHNAAGMGTAASTATHAVEARQVRRHNIKAAATIGAQPLRGTVAPAR
jgi:hypothetical protein